MENLTKMLKLFSAGDESVGKEIHAAVYKQLKQKANFLMAQERKNHTLNPTALVNDVFMKLRFLDDVDWQERRHFFSTASMIMRRILVDHARAKRAEKRGGHQTHLSFEDDNHSDKSSAHIDVVDLHKTLEKLESLDERKAKIIELKFFGGFSQSEIANTLSISEATLKRDLSFAKAWIKKELVK